MDAHPPHDDALAAEYFALDQLTGLLYHVNSRLFLHLNPAKPPDAFYDAKQESLLSASALKTVAKFD